MRRWAYQTSKSGVRLHGRDYDQTNRIFYRAIRDLNKICNIQLEPWRHPHRIDVQFFFRTSWWFRKYAGGNAAGVYWGGRYIVMNKTMRMSDRQARNVVLHELYHRYGLKVPFPYRHNSHPGHDRDGDCMQATTPNNFWFCPRDVIAWQNRMGAPPRMWKNPIMERQKRINSHRRRQRDQFRKWSTPWKQWHGRLVAGWRARQKIRDEWAAVKMMHD